MKHEVKVIFYYPAEISPSPESGSSVRPSAILEALRSKNNWVVSEAIGTSSLRRQSMQKILHDLSMGQRFDFMYGEFTTDSLLFSDPDHLPRGFLRDWRFFAKLKQNGIKIGMYYRDIYWAFPEYRNKLKLIKYVIGRAGYRLDIWLIKRFVNTLFVPTREFGELLERRFGVRNWQPLPPGAAAISTTTQQKSSDCSQVTLVYIGGVLPPYYNIAPLLNFAKERSWVKLQIVCRENEWTQLLAITSPGAVCPRANNIQVSHLTDSELPNVISKADFMIDYRQDDPYLDLAMPIKYMTALSHHLPILTNLGGAIRRFIEEEKIGHTFTSDAELDRILKDYLRTPLTSESLAANIANFCENNSWPRRLDAIQAALQ